MASWVFFLAHALPTLGSADSVHSATEQDNWHHEQGQWYNTQCRKGEKPSPGVSTQRPVTTSHGGHLWLWSFSLSQQYERLVGSLGTAVSMVPGSPCWIWNPRAGELGSLASTSWGTWGYWPCAVLKLHLWVKEKMVSGSEITGACPKWIPAYIYWDEC